jgi:hypothetical protein
VTGKILSTLRSQGTYDSDDEKELCTMFIDLYGFVS